MIFSIAEVMSVRALHTAIRAAGIPDFPSWLAGRDGSEVLRINLSQVEFAEFDALAHVLVMVEAAARNGVPVTIDLPNPLQADGLEREPVGDHARRRARCRQFMFAAGFVTAAALPHLTDSHVEIRNITHGQDDPREGSGWAAGVSMVGPSDATVESPAPDRSGPERTRALPFRWIAPDPGEQLWHSESLISVVSGLRDIGLPASESQLLADAVLIELIENVAEHALAGDSKTPPYALVGAVAFAATTLSRPGFYHSELVDFVEWCGRSDSTSVRIIVADSGAGLVGRLRERTAAGDLDGPVAAGTEGWTDAEQLSLWAMDPARAEAGALRGLWRAREAVGQFRAGAFLTLTVDAAVGHTFIDGAASPARISDRGVGPGTLFDLTVVPATPAELVVNPLGAVPSRAADDLETQWLRLGDGSHDDLVIEQARHIVGKALLLSVDGGDGSLGPDRLGRILRSCAQIAATSVVVLLVTGYDRRSLRIDVNLFYATESNAGAPFLIIDATGHPHWCGGALEERAALNRLRTEQTITDTPDQRPLLVGLRHLIRRTGMSVTLTLDPSMVVGRLERTIEGILDEAVASDEHPGVLTGAFRTPNLRLTRKWVMVDELLDHTVGQGIAAFLLAQKAAALVPESLQPNTQLVLISDVIQDLAATLAGNAGMTQPVHDMSADNDVENTARRLATGARVVLIADILLTQNSVIQRLKPLRRRGVQPIAVIVPLDARVDDGPVRYRGRELPVIALARVGHLVGTVDPSEEVVDIDPIFRTPVKDAGSVEIDHRWSEEEFLRACNQLPSVLWLGHVRRPPRHFTAYFDVSRLLDSGALLRDQIISECATSVESWLADARADDDVPLAICHVGSRDSYAGRLATMVANRLKVGPLATRDCRFVEVPRVVAGHRYAFPDTVKLPNDSDVILVDWGSFDATTINQLVRLAALGGARRIYAVVLLSQLSELDERTLTVWRAVARPSGGTAKFGVRFLTRLGITPLDSADCSLCRMRTELRTNASVGMLPREIAVHAEELASSLRAVNRDNLSNRGTDAFGGRAAIEDTVAYVRLRSMFVRAQRDTSAAQAAADELAAVADAALDLRGHAVIRLLAAEQHWLDLLPIRLSDCYDDVVGLASAVAAEQQIEERLRLQAVIVLAKAAPEVLVERLPEIWRTAQDCDELLLHLLYQLWAMVRPGAVSDVRTSDLAAGVRQCLEFRSTRDDSAERDENLQYLLTRLLQTMYRRDVRPLDLTAQEAWAGLRLEYLSRLGRHTGAEGAAVNILVMTSRLPAEPGALRERSWQTLRGSWNTIAVFLDDRVLRYTASLATLLSGAFAHEYLSTRQRRGLLRLASPNALLDVAALEWQVYSLRGLDRDNRNFAVTWREINEKIAEWHRTVLASGGPREHMADLAELIEPCPAQLVSTVRGLVELSRQREDPLHIRVETGGGDEVEVFCHQELLRSVIQHVIDNAIKPGHRAPTHVDRVLEMEIEIEVRRSVALVRCRNTGTVSTTPFGKGIPAMRRMLRDFGATIDPVTPRAGWSYEIELALDVWSPDLPGAEL